MGMIQQREKISAGEWLFDLKKRKFTEDMRAVFPHLKRPTLRMAPARPPITAGGRAGHTAWTQDMKVHPAASAPR